MVYVAALLVCLTSSSLSSSSSSPFFVSAKKSKKKSSAAAASRDTLHNYVSSRQRSTAQVWRDAFPLELLRPVQQSAHAMLAWQRAHPVPMSDAATAAATAETAAAAKAASDFRGDVDAAAAAAETTVTDPFVRTPKFWYGKGVTPRSAVEEAVARIIELSQLAPLLSGGQWWFESHDVGAGASFRAERDEHVHDTRGYDVHPDMMAVYFLSSYGSSHVVLEQHLPKDASAAQGRAHNYYPYAVEDAHIVGAKANNLFVFQGDFVHGVLPPRHWRERKDHVGHHRLSLHVAMYRYSLTLAPVSPYTSKPDYVAINEFAAALPSSYEHPEETEYADMLVNDDVDSEAVIAGLQDPLRVGGVYHFNKMELRSFRKLVDNLNSVHPKSGLSQSLRTLVNIPELDMSASSMVPHYAHAVTLPNGMRQRLRLPLHLRQGTIYTLAQISGIRSPRSPPRNMRKYMDKQAAKAAQAAAAAAGSGDDGGGSGKRSAADHKGKKGKKGKASKKKSTKDEL